MGNVFDNPSFFSKYMELRSDYNYNDYLEHPAMESLLPPLKGRSVLDLGCGYGAYAMSFMRKGASSYLGLDSSSHMIEKARTENAGAGISYRVLDLKSLDTLSTVFDVAYSSLVFHYIEDFDTLLRNIYAILSDDGVLLFSQMHPLLTASYGYSGYFEGDYFAFSSYQEEGRREGRWFKEKVVSYHRRLSSILNSLSGSGFIVDRVLEPIPREEDIREFSQLERDLVRPTFLCIRAVKKKSK